MKEKIVQTNGRETGIDSQPHKSNSQFVEVYRPKRWVPVLFVISLLVVGAGGVLFIIWASRLFTDPTAALTFIMGSIISLFILLSTVATTCIYWGQRNIMLQQWRAMNESIVRTDKIISKMAGHQAAMELQAGIAEIQTGLVDQQVGAMKDQVLAMQGQLTVMSNQEAAMRDQVRIMGDALIITNRAYVGVQSVRGEWDKGRVVLMIGNDGNVPADYVRVSGGVMVLHFEGGLRDRKLKLAKRTFPATSEISVSLRAICLSA